VLAYVFFHRPGPGVDTQAYEGTLRGFHAALEGGSIRGFIRSASYAVGAGYADWYLVDDSAALDALNQAAMTGARTKAHDLAARMAADGVGKLLRLVSGESDLDAGHEVRFAKPIGMTYGDLFRNVEPWTALQGTSLWQRMMVLGPPPEFCLVSPAEVELPAYTQPEHWARRRV
jgi:hypothetical protein